VTIPSALVAADRRQQRGDWEHLLCWRPALWRRGTLYEFPRPVPRVRIHESWDALRFKVPLHDGETWAGLSRNGLEIHLEGEITAADPLTLLLVLAELRAALHFTADDEKAWLFVYRDAEAEVYRHFRGCSTRRFAYDLCDTGAIRYSAVLQADDPTLYSTGPA